MNAFVSALCVLLCVFFFAWHIANLCVCPPVCFSVYLCTRLFVPFGMNLYMSLSVPYWMLFNALFLCSCLCLCVYLCLGFFCVFAFTLPSVCFSSSFVNAFACAFVVPLCMPCACLVCALFCVGCDFMPT